MRKTFALLAVLVFGFSMISCEADTNVEETEALFENLDVDATDGEEEASGERGGDN